MSFPKTGVPSPFSPRPSNSSGAIKGNSPRIKVVTSGSKSSGTSSPIHQFINSIPKPKSGITRTPTGLL